MDLVNLFVSADPRGADLVNLILCLLGALWLVGVKRESRSRLEWRTWFVFWVATGLYYAMLAIVEVTDSSRCIDGVVLCALSGCKHHSSVPGFVSRLGPPFEQAGLYVATAALLWGNRPGRAGRGAAWLLPALLVTTAALLDFFIGCRLGIDHTGVHQTLTALAIGQAAWRLRERDQTKSSALLLYALVQLPVRPLMQLWGIQTAGHSEFVRSTLAVYAALKLALIPVTCFIATKADSDVPKGSRTVTDDSS
jgi:hypothetical protein